jgi:hypothetical protein
MLLLPLLLLVFWKLYIRTPITKQLPFLLVKYLLWNWATSYNQMFTLPNGLGIFKIEPKKPYNQMLPLRLVKEYFLKWPLNSLWPNIVFILNLIFFHKSAENIHKQTWAYSQGLFLCTEWVFHYREMFGYGCAYPMCTIQRAMWRAHHDVFYPCFSYTQP